MRHLLIALAGCIAWSAAPAPGLAQAWHRMGGMPDMPAEILKPPEGEPHHLLYHQAGAKPLKAFAFGQPGNETNISRTIEVDIRDDTGFSIDNMEVRAGETIRFVVRNLGRMRHEIRIGDPDYQLAHAEMVRRMPAVEHDDPNAIIVAPGESGWIIWQFGSSAVVELACHLSGPDFAAGHATVHVVASP